MENTNTYNVNPATSRERRRGLTGGLVLISLGLVFLGHSLGWPVPENWWAVFLLIPAVPSLVRGAALFRNGRSLAALRALTSSLVLLPRAAR